MTPEKKDWADQFMRHARRWTWSFFFRRLGATDLLIIDTDMLKAFEERYDTVSCATLPPARALSRLDSETRRIFVLCRKGEWSLVKKLRKKYPRKRIFSCTYDLAPRSLFDRPKLAAKEKADTAPRVRPVVLISTPYSDAEFLVDILRRNKLAAPREYFDRPLATWLQEHEGFQISRYFNTVEKLYREDGVFDLHLQTDVMAMLFEKSRANWTMLATWLKENDAKVIYFSRRDKMAQTGFAGLLDGSIFRSVMEMNPTQRRAFQPKTGTFAESNAWLQKLLEQEAHLEDFLSEQIVDFRSITLEELVEQPVEVLRALTIFLEQKTPQTFEMADYQEPYRKLPLLWENAVKFRQELIDRLGLHVNAAGSLVTYTDNLLKK